MQPKIMGLRATPAAACIVCDHPLFNQPLLRQSKTHTHTRINAMTRPQPTYCTYGRPFNVGIVDDDDETRVNFISILQTAFGSVDLR